MKIQVLGIATQVLVMAIVVSVVLVFVGIGVLIMIHFCIVGRAFRLGFGNNNSNSSMMQQRGRSLGSTSMSKEDLEKLPCFDFKAKELKGSSRTSSTSPVDCAVCLENFKVGEKCRLLPLCRHSFHAECVDMWLLRTPICPICRASADFTRVAEESNQNGDIGYQLRNYSQMRNESEHFMEAAFETGAGDQPRDDQTVMGSTQSSETGTPENGSYVSETVAMEMRGSQLAAEFEARVHQTV